MKKAVKETVSSGNNIESQSKSHPSWVRKSEVSLKNKGPLYFQLGLILAMVLAYLGLEASFRTETSEDSWKYIPNEEIVLYEEIPILNPEKPVMREKKVVYNPSEILIDDTDPSDVEAVIEPVSPQFPPLPLDSIRYSDPAKEEPPVILINLVDEVPVFPGCEAVEKEQRLECFNQKIQEHIRKNFKYPEAAINLGIRGKVNMSFTIDEHGRVGSLKMIGPSPILENEAERIILKLPVMIPGKQGGKPVKVPYSLPINFKIN